MVFHGLTIVEFQPIFYTAVIASLPFGISTRTRLRLSVLSSLYPESSSLDK